MLASLASRPLAAFPVSSAGRLPRYPFRGLLNVHCALSPARSLNRPRRPFSIEVLQSVSLPPRTAPIATGWSDSCRTGSAPAEKQRLSTAHDEPGLGALRRHRQDGSAPGASQRIDKIMCGAEIQTPRTRSYGPSARRFSKIWAWSRQPTAKSRSPSPSISPSTASWVRPLVFTDHEGSDESCPSSFR